VLAELSLRVHASLTGHSPVADRILEAYRLVPGRDYGFGLHGNSLGYAGPEFQRQRRWGVFRIAALGDSFAIGPAVPFEDDYLTVLEKRLANTEVYNFGVSGAGLREFAQVLQQHVWEFQPDLVLVSIFIGHDLTESLPMPRYLDPRQHLLYSLLAPGARPDGAEPAWVANRLAMGTLSAEEFRQVEVRRLAVCLKAAPPGLEKKWQQAFTLLRRMISSCAKRRIPVAFVLIPDEFQINPEVLKETLAAAEVGAEAVDLELPQRRLQQFLNEQGGPCLDLQATFRGVPNTYAPRHTHWNKRGNHLAAEQIGQWLELAKLAPGGRH
jgi:hypothetical protein